MFYKWTSYTKSISQGMKRMHQIFRRGLVSSGFYRLQEYASDEITANRRAAQLKKVVLSVCLKPLFCQVMKMWQ